MATDLNDRKTKGKEKRLDCELKPSVGKMCESVCGCVIRNSEGAIKKCIFYNILLVLTL